MSLENGPFDNLKLTDFTILREIARSSTGAVYKARLNSSRQVVVLKERRCSEIGYDSRLLQYIDRLTCFGHANHFFCVDRPSFPRNGGGVLFEFECVPIHLRKYHDILHEVNLLGRLRHPNIIQYLGHFFHGERQHLFIILEYAKYGDLFSVIAARRCAAMGQTGAANTIIPRASPNVHYLKRLYVNLTLYLQGRRPRQRARQLPLLHTWWLAV